MPQPWVHLIEIPRGVEIFAALFHVRHPMSDKWPTYLTFPSLPACTFLRQMMHGECIVPHDTFPPPSFKFRANFPPIKSGNNAAGSRKFDSCGLRDTRISFPETRFANKSPLFPRWRVLYLATSRIELTRFLWRNPHMRTLQWWPTRGVMILKFLFDSNRNHGQSRIITPLYLCSAINETILNSLISNATSRWAIL